MEHRIVSSILLKKRSSVLNFSRKKYLEVELLHLCAGTEPEAEDVKQLITPATNNFLASLLVSVHMSRKEKH